MLTGNRFSRRQALQTGAGACLAPLAADRLRGIWPSVKAKAELVTKPIPSTGEQLPVIGIGTARRFDVGTSEKERGPIREVLRELPQAGRHGWSIPRHPTARPRRSSAT